MCLEESNTTELGDSIKKDDSYQNGNCVGLAKAKLRVQEDHFRTGRTVHHHGRNSLHKDALLVETI